MSYGDMTGRTCLVTGATSGHGRAFARGLAANGADVVLLGRNPGILYTLARLDICEMRPHPLYCAAPPGGSA